jgi:MFS family permease
VVGVSTTVNALAWGARSTFALYYVAMLEEFAWGRGPTALGYSLSWLGFVVCAPLAGWLSDRWGTRTVVTVGGVILGAALALTGQVTSLAQYYLAFGALGAAGIAGMLIPSTTIVTRWFVRSRGTAMGVLSTGPASAVVFYPLNAWLITSLGWRGALGAFGCIVAVATVALALLYREPPAGDDRPSQATRVTGETLRSVSIGIAAGLAGAQLAVSALVAILTDVQPPSGLIWGGAIVVLCAVSAMAAAVPARRVVCIDPATALRT